MTIPGSEARAAEAWQSQALTACARYACDPDLLIAIGSHEPDARKNQSLGDGGLSFGRWQMKASTAARFVLGTTDTRRMTAEQYLIVARMLTDDLMAAELAARELSRCSARNRMLEYRIRCWNNDSNYVSKVMAIYRTRKMAKR